MNRSLLFTVNTDFAIVLVIVFGLFAGSFVYTFGKAVEGDIELMSVSARYLEEIDSM